MEALVIGQDQLADDPRDSLTRGDVVNLKPDDFVWGDCEVAPMFEVVHFDGVTLPAYLLESWQNADGTPYRRSLWKWDFDQGGFRRKSDGILRRF